MVKMILCIFLLAITMAATGNTQDRFTVISSEVGQQAVFDETRRLTVFRDEAISIDDPICVYLDSSHLESEGYNKVEWYYLARVDKGYLSIEKRGSDIKLPSFVMTNETVSSIEVPLAGYTTLSGIFTVEDVKIRLTVTGEDTVEAKIVE